MHAAWTQVDEVTWVFTIQADRFLRNSGTCCSGYIARSRRGKLTIGGFRRVIDKKTGAVQELPFPVTLCSL